MANFVPENLDKCVPVEIREQVLNALRYQPPGLATYEQVYEHFRLDQYGVEIGTVQRRGRKEREAIAEATSQRLQGIRDVKSAICGEVEVDAETAELLYAEMFSHLISEQRDPKTIVRLAGSIRSLTAANIARAVEKRKAIEWSEQREKVRAAIAAAENNSASAEDRNAKLVDELKQIYGLA